MLEPEVRTLLQELETNTKKIAEKFGITVHEEEPKEQPQTEPKKETKIWL